MKKGLFLIFLSTLFLSILFIEAETRQPTAAEYLEAARIQYNNPNLQLEDLYIDVHESLTWVGIRPTPAPDKLEVHITLNPKTRLNK